MVTLAQLPLLCIGNQQVYELLVLVCIGRQWRDLPDDLEPSPELAHVAALSRPVVVLTTQSIYIDLI